MKKYNPSNIEKKWQEYWQANQTFAASENTSKEKKYILVEFPFPSGDGMHMGHVRPYTAADVTARYYRMRGKEVLFPIGWDAFGLPAENYAIKQGVQPAVSTAKNISNIKKQFQNMGYSFDWNREINTTDPEYYKWTQWLFLQFYKAGLAYEATGLINWCPKDKTGLANEEVLGGTCERCGTDVEKKELRQWYLKITAYAEKLLEGLKHLPEWPDAVKLQQKNWIGKSTGADLDFLLDFKRNPQDNDNRGPKGQRAAIKVFTTRPDTLYGATYLVLAPEHPWVTLAIDAHHDVLENKDEVVAYVESVKSRSEIERSAEGKDKTGIELLGVKAINPASGKEIPIFVADYVLGHYGTGAIMAVPAHDERDFEFATKFKLPIVSVIESETALPFSGIGTLINSGEFTGMSSEVALPKMAEQFGKATTQYKLRDWVFSRQRYWGEPIPLVHCNACGIVAVPEEQLPVVLPEVEKYEPTGTGESPLAAIDEWVNTMCPKCEGPAKRETNTMPQWAGSSWYYLRYTDAKNNTQFASREKLAYWLPVDTYFGGMEHTTLHLLYSRFWNIFLYDQKLVPVSEPYKQRVPHGIILAANGEKMSKSKGNVVNPDSIIKEYGADTTRMYELFLGPHEASVSWSDQGIIGVARFLDRIWYWVHKSDRVKQDSEEVTRAINKLIKKVTEDIEVYSFNTIVSGLMQFHNQIKDQPVTVETLQTFLKLLYPIAPHIAEDLFEISGGSGSLQHQPWPISDPTKLNADNMKFVVQIDGKVRDVLSLSADASEYDMKTAALASSKIKEILSGKEPAEIIVVKGKVVNLVMNR